MNSSTQMNFDRATRDRSEPIHVVHVLHSLEVGGTENGVVNLINGAANGFRHTVISMTVSGPLRDRLPADTAVYCLGKRPTLDLRTTLGLARLLRRLKPEIVHSRNWASFDAILAGKLARVPRILHGEHGRGADDPEGTNAKRNRLRRMFSPWVDRFITVSFDLRRWLIETVRIPAKKVVTIHNGVDTNRFSVHGRDEGRRKLEIPDGWAVVGTVGRLDPVKDQMGLLEAFAHIDREKLRAMLVIVGDGPCRAELEARASEPDLRGRVRLTGEQKDVSSLLQGMDVFVLPSIAEGISNTILEAMSTGLPVIATRTGGNPELVEDGVTGSLVPVRDPRTLARALEHYLGDSPMRRRRGEAGRERVEERFSLARMTTAYRSLYEEVAGRKRRGRR